jgi:hypothetical protein
MNCKYPPMYYIYVHIFSKVQLQRAWILTPHLNLRILNVVRIPPTTPTSPDYNLDCLNSPQIGLDLNCRKGRGYIDILNAQCLSYTTLERILGGLRFSDSKINPFRIWFQIQEDVFKTTLKSHSVRWP